MRRKVGLQNPVQRSPVFHVTLRAVVFEHTVDGRDVATFVDVVVALGPLVADPDGSQDAQPQRRPPRPATEPVRPLLNVDFDSFRKFTTGVRK